MTNMFRVLAVDAYLRAEQTIKAEQSNVARMTVRYLANSNDANLLDVLKETIADDLEIDTESLTLVPFYENDDQWGIYAKYSDKYDDYCTEVSAKTIYKFAWNLCSF